MYSHASIYWLLVWNTFLMMYFLCLWICLYRYTAQQFISVDSERDKKKSKSSCSNLHIFLFLLSDNRIRYKSDKLINTMLASCHYQAAELHIKSQIYDHNIARQNKHKYRFMTIAVLRDQLYISRNLMQSEAVWVQSKDRLLTTLIMPSNPELELTLPRAKINLCRKVSHCINMMLIKIKLFSGQGSGRMTLSSHFTHTSWIS